MLTFLFWNLNRKPLQELVAQLVVRHDIDVLIMAECVLPLDSLLRQLNSRKGAEFHLTASKSKRLVLLTRFSRAFLDLRDEENRHLVYRVFLPQRIEFLLAAVHFPSKLRQSPHSLEQKVIGFSNRLRSIEAAVGHARTLLVGDLNMNPFEAGVISAHGLHAGHDS